MDERLRKYYDGRTCGLDLDRGSAVATLATLLGGDTHDGDLFRMNSDEFMKEHLLPEDYDYWLSEKGRAIK